MSHKASTTLKDQLIQQNLKRAFDDKAGEDVPNELLALIDKLREQDEKNGPE